MTARGGERAAARWPAVTAVGCGILVLVTTELLPVGLLTPVSTTMAVSEGTAGLLVTVPGLIAAVSAPVCAAATGRHDRRHVLSALMALLVVANLLAAAAGSFGSLLVARVLAGVSIGGFWALAGGLGGRLVPAAAGRATAVIFGGVALASVVGVPLGTQLGALLGWRTALVAAAGAAALVTLALWVWLPPLPGAAVGSSGPALRRQLADRGVRRGLVLTAALVTGHFTAYTFLAPLIEGAGGSEGAPVGGALALFGVAGVIGNFVAGPAAGRHLRRSATVIALSLGTTLLVVPLVVGGPGSAIVLVGWGLAWGGVSVTLQTWMSAAAPRDTEAATSLLVVAFNLAVALGAATGGRAIDLLGTSGVTTVGAAIVLLASWPLAAARDGTPRTVRPGGTDPVSPSHPHRGLHEETC